MRILRARRPIHLVHRKAIRLKLPATFPHPQETFRRGERPRDARRRRRFKSLFQQGCRWFRHVGSLPRRQVLRPVLFAEKGCPAADLSIDRLRKLYGRYTALRRDLDHGGRRGGESGTAKLNSEITRKDVAQRIEQLHEESAEKTSLQRYDTWRMILSLLFFGIIVFAVFFKFTR